MDISDAIQIKVENGPACTDDSYTTAVKVI